MTWTKNSDGSEIHAGHRVCLFRQDDVHRLEIRSAGPSDSGQYICTASSSEGRVTATVTVTVEGKILILMAHAAMYAIFTVTVTVEGKILILMAHAAGHAIFTVTVTVEGKILILMAHAAMYAISTPCVRVNVFEVV